MDVPAPHGEAIGVDVPDEMQVKRPCISEAVDRGELPAGTDPGLVVRAVSAPLYYAFLISGEPLTRRLAERAADAAIAAAKAGVYR